MKKVLFFAALICGLVIPNAKGQIGLLYNGQCYQPGETVVVAIQKTDHSVRSIGFRNMGSGIISNVVATLTEVETNGVVAWGMCTGDQCVATLTSAPFDLPPAEDYTTFSIDIDIEDVANPYGVYNLNLVSGLVDCGFVVRFEAGSQGINDVVANASVSAYPNPAQGQVSMNYSVEQPSTLAIYDAQGRVVRQMNVQGEGTMQINGLAAGIYAYGIAGSQMHKLIVK